MPGKAHGGIKSDIDCERMADGRREADHDFGGHGSKVCGDVPLSGGVVPGKHSMDTLKSSGYLCDLRQVVGVHREQYGVYVRKSGRGGHRRPEVSEKNVPVDQAVQQRVDPAAIST
ncbi:hypothetical protein SAMN06264365_13132 [Actinoplanes regularis]|uniref:Uncharacterized protein n=1 Tax=Actinoplanes regularis TaxID=52697 RepID=A0A239IVJ0_9ACTN|nr:hypothetical protein Are01nite_80730 [Actinoplanes regularis]SNS97627.1 hypothetical protein SAMN06264365_13132 [Actinoplanes regularis]